MVSPGVERELPSANLAVAGLSGLVLLGACAGALSSLACFFRGFVTSVDKLAGDGVEGTREERHLESTPPASKRTHI
eukprot:7801221-Alexandrium_andersonii.AAC.1